MSASHKAYSDGSKDEAAADRSEGEGSGLQPRGTFERASAERLPPERDDGTERGPAEPEEPEHGPVDPDAPEPPQQQRVAVAPPAPPPLVKRSSPPPQERIDFDLVVQEARSTNRLGSFESSASLIPQAPRSRSLEAPSSYPPPRASRSPMLLIGSVACVSLVVLAGALWFLHSDRTEDRVARTAPTRAAPQRTESPAIQRIESAATATEPRPESASITVGEPSPSTPPAPSTSPAPTAPPARIVPPVTTTAPVANARSAPQRSTLSDLQEERQIAREQRTPTEAAPPSPSIAPQPAPSGEAAPGLPETPVREHVLAAFDGVRNAVRACLPGPRVVPVRVTVASSGRVTTALVLSSDLAGTSEGSCVARAIRQARFPAFARPYFVVDYPFQL